MIKTFENTPKITIEYDGKYPNLCSGHLVVTIDDVKYNFPDYCMSSGGCICRNEDWDMWAEYGPWSIVEWPENFPEEYKELTLTKVNYTIPYGCCGGCI